MRAALTIGLATAAALAAAVPASATPATPLLAAGEGTFVAISGDEVLLGSSSGGRALVRGIPAAGGDPVVRFRAPQAPRGRISAVRLLDASERRVAFMTVEAASDEGPVTRVSAYAGPPAGPYALISSGRPSATAQRVPGWIDVDGDRVLLVDIQNRRPVATVIEADGSRAAVPLPRDGYDPRLAGDLVTARTDPPTGSDDTGRLRIFDRRTGGTRTLVTPAGSDEYAVRADGLVVTDVGGNRGLVAMAPGAESRRLGAGTSLGALDGPAEELLIRGDVALGLAFPSRLVESGERVAVIPIAGGPPRLAGPVTSNVSAAAIGDRWVAWVANGCLAAVSRAALPAAEPIAAGGCPRAEATIEEGTSEPRARVRRVLARAGCLTAPGDRCDIVVAAELDPDRGARVSLASRRVAVAAGRSRLVSLPLTGADVRALRRASDDDGFAPIRLTAAAVDPAGRRSTAVAGSFVCPDRCRSPR